LSPCFLVFFPLQAFAEVLHYSKCSTNDGKTIADVQTWVNDWRALAKKRSIQYHVRLLVPHADPRSRARRRRGTGGTPTPRRWLRISS
jgi:hypothetical protein